MSIRPCLLWLALLPAVAASAAETPEIKRAVGTPQAAGVVHTLRQIPEACARLEGRFTGDAAQPYAFTPVRSSPQCQPRARLVEFATAQPSEAKGWLLNDVIRVPNAACPAQQAVVRVWRLAAAPKRELDGQGQTRIYLQDVKEQAAAGKAAPAAQFTAQLQMEGQACR